MSGPHRQPAIHALDGVRAAACLAVVLGHAGYQGFMFVLSGVATFGVMLFFTLSGFLMAYHYLPERFSLRYWVSFLTHRLIRVYPAFCIALVGYWLVRPHLPVDFPMGNGQPIWDELKNGWLLRDGRGIFWTVPVEISFYCLYPLLATLVTLIGKRRVALLTLSSLLVILAGLKLFVYPEWLYLSHFSLFLCGVTASMALRHLGDSRSRSPMLLSRLAAVTLALLFPLVLTNALIKISSSQIWVCALYFGPIIGAFLVGMAQPQRGMGLLVSKLLSHPVMRWLGHVSYSMYLMHFFVITAVRVYFPSYVNHLLTVFVAVVLAAWIFFHLIEQPFTRLGKWSGAKIRSVGESAKPIAAPAAAGG